MEYKYDVFISYSRKDSDIANKICQAFDRVGVSYFIDRKGIGGGMEFPAVLAKAIKESHVFLFLASKNSYDSKFTQSEIVYAFNKKKKEDILPYIIDGSNLPDELEFTFSSINWRQMDRHPIDTVLLNDIKQKIDKPLNLDGDTVPNNNIQNVGRSKITRFFLSGKNIALTALFISSFLFALGIFLNFLWKHNNWEKSSAANTFLLYTCMTLFFPIFGCLIVGLIRPESVCLDNRKKVLVYYLLSIFFLMLGIGAYAS